MEKYCFLPIEGSYRVKASTLLQLIDKFNTFPIKSPSKIFCRYKQIILKHIWETKGIITAKTILIKKEEGKKVRKSVYPISRLTTWPR